MDALANETYYTYTDYLAWPGETRYELIGGMPYLLASPSQAHQTVSGELFALLHAFLKGKPCKVFAAPFDVRLNPDSGDDTVVQPDLLVVCDQTKLDGKACVGAPDLVVEILSPSSAKMDCLIKQRLYQKAGVCEYWIADPESRTVYVLLQRDGGYDLKEYAGEAVVPVTVLPGCEISLQDIFLYEVG